MKDNCAFRTCVTAAMTAVVLVLCGCGLWPWGDVSPEARARIKAMQENTSSTLPEDFPEDVPVYPGLTGTLCTLLGRDYKQATPDAGFESAISVTGDTLDSPATVMAFYREELAKNGWEADPEKAAVTPEGFIAEFTKDRRKVSVAVLAVAPDIPSFLTLMVFTMEPTDSTPEGTT